MSEANADDIQIVERNAFTGQSILFLIGPGASGKTTLGQYLATRLSHDLLDIDEIFIAQLGNISTYIRDHGYSAYKHANSLLAETLVHEAAGPSIIVTSSGFLTPDNPPDALARNRGLIAQGYSLSLLPSRDVEDSVPVIVARQLARPFARDAAREEAVIRERFPLYADAGDMLIASTAPPQRIASAIAARFAALDPSALRR